MFQKYFWRVPERTQQLMVENFSGSHKSLKITKIYDLGVVGHVFCSSEELTKTNVQVQFRVIPSFKFHDLKGFYRANVPGVTQKLALLTFFKYIFSSTCTDVQYHKRVITDPPLMKSSKF